MVCARVANREPRHDPGMLECRRPRANPRIEDSYRTERSPLAGVDRGPRHASVSASVRKPSSIAYA